MEFKDYKIEDFINDLSSPLPSPGGGSVAGLVGALSGSLNSMVYSLTVNGLAVGGELLICLVLLAFLPTEKLIKILKSNITTA